MPGTQDQDTVKPLSHVPRGEDGKVTPGTPPTPTPRTSTPKKNDEGINPPSPEQAKNAVSSVLNGEVSNTGETPLPLPQKSQALQDKEDKNLFDLSTEVPAPSLEDTKGETHDWVSQTASLGLRESSSDGSEEGDYAELNLPPSEGSSSNGFKKPTYTTVDFSKRTPKKSLSNDSGIDDQSPGMRRSVSKETVFDPPCDKEESEENFYEKLNQHSNGLGTSSTILPSYNSQQLLTTDENSKNSTISKKTNRIWPRAKYAMQQKSFVIPATSSFLITIYLSSSYLYRLLYLKETINFIDSIKSFQIWPLVTISSGLAVIGLCALIYNYRNTESPDVRGIDGLRNVVSENNLVHDITIYKKNNDLIKFKNKSYAGHRNIPNFTYKKLKLVKERALFNICLSSFITIGSIYPLIKYLELGSEGFIKFFSFSSEKEALMISKFFAPENDAKLLSYFNNHNLKLFAFAAVLTVLAASLIGTVYYYHNEKTHIEPLKFDILAADNVKARNDRYFEVVKDKISKDKISTEIETVVVRHYNDVDEEKKTTVSALKMAR